MFQVAEEDDYDSMTEDILGKQDAGAGDGDSDDEPFGERRRNRGDEENDSEPSYCVFDFRRGQKK